MRFSHLLAFLICLGSFESGLVWAQLPALIELTDPPGSESTDVTRIYGDDAGDRIGGGEHHNVGEGDINGDGYDDLIIAGYFSGVGGGETIVIYGSGSIRSSAEINLDSDDTISPAGETRIWGDWGQMGYSVASGDVNGDGYDDVITHDVFTFTFSPDRILAGEVDIIYGSPTLPGQIVDLDTAFGPPGTLSPHGETRIHGDDENDFLGRHLAAGDINGDGYVDIVASATGSLATGEVFVFPGGPNLPGKFIDLDTDGAISASGETRILGDDLGDSLGNSVAVGDINGDGFDDVLTSATNADTIAGTGVGEVYVIYGNANFFGQIVNLDTDGAISGFGETRILGDDANDFLGLKLSAGDVNGDGYDDVLITGWSVQGPVTDDGGGYVIWGSPTLPGTIVDLNTNQTISAANEARFYGQAGLSANNLFGSTGDLGDVNGDGFADVVIGCRGYDRFGFSNFGGLNVFYGSTTLPGQLFDLNVVSSEVTAYSASPLDRWGWGGTSATGDFDRDGFSDFAMGTINGDNPYLGTADDNDAGMIPLIYGDGTALSATVGRFTRTGDGVGGDIVPRTDFGAVPRAVVDFSDDDSADNGLGGASFTIVTLTRTDTGTSNITPLSEVADVAWEITTDRVGWASAEVTLQYTDAEIATVPGLNESNLVVFTAPTAAGPWVQVLTTVNTLRNEVSFTVTSFSHFVIADGSTTLSTPAIPIIDPIAGDLAFEGLPYTGPTPTLSQGTLPVAWTLETGPGGMTVDGGTGVVSWATPTTAGSPHTVTIRASNEAGFDDESWPLSVSPPILSAEDEVKVNLSQWEYAPDIVTPFGSFPGDSMSTGKNPDDGVDGSGADLSIGTSNLGSGQAFAHWDSPPDLIGFNADATYRVSWQIAATGFASPQNVPQMRLRAGYGFTGGLGATDVVVPETGAAAPTVGGETTYQLFFDELDVAAADGTVTVSLGTPFDGQTSTENAKRLFFDWVDFEGQSTPLGGGALELECVVIQRFTKGDILAVALVEDEITEFTQGVEVDLFGGTLDTSPGSALNVTFETGSALIESTGTNTAGAILLFNTLPLQLDVAGVAALPLTPSSPSEERIYRAEVGFSAITGAPDVPPMRVILGAFDSGNLVNTISTEYIINALRGNLEGDETANPALGAMSFSAYLALPSNQPTLGGAVGDQVQASLSLIDQDSPYVSAGSVRIDTIRIESFAANLLP